jgi:hypothetical protein
MTRTHHRLPLVGPSISGWAGKNPPQEGLVFGSVARLPLVGPEHQWVGRKKPSQEGLVFGSVARLPLVGPEHQWVGRQKPKAISNTHTERRIPEQSTQVVSSSISGSLTIGNESPFQAHSVLESSSDFRLILRLENAVFTNPPGWFVGVSDNWPKRRWRKCDLHVGWAERPTRTGGSKVPARPAHRGADRPGGLSY